MRKLSFVITMALILILLCVSCRASEKISVPEGELDIKTAVLERLLSYVVHDTQSDPNSDAVPSTSKQMDFAKILAQECRRIGLSDVQLSPHGIITATLPSNIDAALPVIGLIAHMDTAPDASGKGVVARLHENYDGQDIILNSGTVISPNEFPALRNYIGQTIITASGDTLLGADDKAGIAIILTAMEYFIRNPDIPRGKIRIAFTPDEEIGRGTANFDVAAFGADFAFTIDGGHLGELQFENFNAARAVFEITGNKPIAFHLTDSPFGAEPFDADFDMSFDNRAGNFADNFDAYIFLQPIKDEDAEYLLYDILNDEFIEEMKRRAALTNWGNPSRWFGIEGELTKEKIIKSFNEKYKGKKRWGDLF